MKHIRAAKAITQEGNLTDLTIIKQERLLNTVKKMKKIRFIYPQKIT